MLYYATMTQIKKRTAASAANRVTRQQTALSRCVTYPRAEIEYKDDPNEVTFKPVNDLMPMWSAVLRHRYMTDMVAKGYTCVWEDYKQDPDNGTKLQPLSGIHYNDGSISLKPLHPELTMTKIIASLDQTPRITLHMYPRT
jgi:hypothetical protein